MSNLVILFWKKIKKFDKNWNTHFIIDLNIGRTGLSLLNIYYTTYFQKYLRSKKRFAIKNWHNVHPFCLVIFFCILKFRIISQILNSEKKVNIERCKTFETVKLSFSPLLFTLKSNFWIFNSFTWITFKVSWGYSVNRGVITW